MSFRQSRSCAPLCVPGRAAEGEGASEGREGGEHGGGGVRRAAGLERSSYLLSNEVGGEAADGHAECLAQLERVGGIVDAFVCA